jgi:hypothetical protein
MKGTWLPLAVTLMIQAMVSMAVLVRKQLGNLAFTHNFLPRA